MRRFRAQGRHHYGGSGEKWLRTRRSWGDIPLPDDNSQDADDNNRPAEGVPADSGREMVGEDKQETERQGDRVQCGVTEADSGEIDGSRCYILSEN